MPLLAPREFRGARGQPQGHNSNEKGPLPIGRGALILADLLSRHRVLISMSTPLGRSSLIKASTVLLVGSLISRMRL